MAATGRLSYHLASAPPYHPVMRTFAVFIYLFILIFINIKYNTLKYIKMLKYIKYNNKDTIKIQ